MKPTLTQLSEGFDRAISLGYCVNVSVYGWEKATVHVGLTKYASGFGGTETKVAGKGATVEEAFQAAFENFPKNPLDGSQWIEANSTRSITHED
jgi:hypothetical protein